MDDYLAHPNSLQTLVDNFRGGWLVTGCTHDDGQMIGSPHHPKWNPNVKNGENTIGSPSVIAFENKEPLLFDEEMSWLLDCDYYHRLYQRYGEPTIVDDLSVIIGVGGHQMTNLLTVEEKQKEVYYIKNKYQ